jgi:hypothetical protein
MPPPVRDTRARLQVWELSDEGGAGSLDRSAFKVAMMLVSLAQVRPNETTQQRCGLRTQRVAQQLSDCLLHA